MVSRWLVEFLIGTLVVGDVAATAAASSSDTASSSLSADCHVQQQRPPFVAHVTLDALDRARALAQDRHQWAIREAREHYPWQPLTPHPEAAAAVVEERMGQEGTLPVKFQTHTLEGVSLPDFHSLLGEEAKQSVTVSVTDPNSEDSSSPLRLLSRDECATVIQMAEDHFAVTATGSTNTTNTNSSQWTRQASGQYGVAGFMIRDVPAVKAPW